MKKTSLIIMGVFAIIACTSNQHQKSYEESYSGKYSESYTKDDSDGLDLLISSINAVFPLSLDFGVLEGKSISYDKAREIVTLYIFAYERVQDWGLDTNVGTDKELGKYMVALLMSIPEKIEQLSKSDPEDLEEIKRKESICLALENPQPYKQIRKMLTEIKNQGLGIKFKFYGKDNCTATVDLSSSEVQDAVTFYKEIVRIAEEKNRGYDF